MYVEDTFNLIMIYYFLISVTSNVQFASVESVAT